MSANFVPGRLAPGRLVPGRVVVFATIAAALSIAPAAARGPAQPEASSGFTERSAARARQFMAVTANPHASRAARDVLAAGGSAVDAAIAAQMVLTLVEPQSSGIGGGAFLLYYDAGTRTVRAFDGRETAPSAATPSLFVARDGEPMAFFEAIVWARFIAFCQLVVAIQKAQAKKSKSKSRRR